MPTTRDRRVGRPRSGPCTWLLPLLLIATGAAAEDRLWNNGDGSVFGDEANWDDGASGVPGAADAAVFDIASVYTVQFLASRVTDRVVVQRGVVSLDLEPFLGYGLLNPLPITPGIVVGAEAGDVADLSLLTGPLSGAFADLGQTGGAYGRLAVDAPGAHLEVAELLRVGNAGSGVLDVGGGRSVTSGASALGQLGGGFGSASVRGAGSSWLTDGMLSVGVRGVGDLLVEDGAEARCAQAIIAQNVASIGTVSLTGAESSWAIDGSLDVGMSGFGALLVDDGASVTNRVFAVIGTFPDFPPGAGGNGTVTVRGPGSRWTVESDGFDGEIEVGGFGRGRLVLSSGGRVFPGGDLGLNDNSDGGDLDLLVFEFADAADYPAAALTVAGVVRSNVAAPRARIDLLASYTPAAGDAFTLVSAASGTDLIDVATPPLPSSLAWGVTQTSELLRVLIAPDDCVFSPGNGEDCNDNGLFDICDLFLDFSADCNDNDVPDECDIAGGASADCNGNGVPDSCDLAAGSSEDCNDNDIPDECEIVDSVDAASGLLSPIGNGSPQSFTIADAPDATGDVTLLFSVSADLDSAAEYIDVDLNGTVLGRIFEPFAGSCASPPDEMLLIVPQADYNTALAGLPDAVLTMTASEDVSTASCGGESFIAVEVSYPVLAANDVNGNGVPDECECLADILGDGEVNFFDLVALLSNWGPCAGCPHDLDGDGVVGFSDLLILLFSWGPCE